MNMTFAGTNSREDVYVLEGLRTPLLGKPAIERLCVLPQINVIKKLDPESEFPQVFQGLGTFKEEYDLKLNPEAKPFALPLFEKTRQEPERMQALGVISPVTEPTTWCAPMVVVLWCCSNLCRLHGTQQIRSTRMASYPGRRVHHRNATGSEHVFETRASGRYR